MKLTILLSWYIVLYDKYMIIILINDDLWMLRNVYIILNSDERKNKSLEKTNKSIELMISIIIIIVFNIDII